MPLWRIYYHIVWATKDRLPLITPSLEEGLFGYLVGKAAALDTAVHAIGGVEDHIHMVLSIPPKHSVAEAVRQLKGASSHWASEQQDGSAGLSWQRGYGVFSLGAKQLKEAVDYVQGQKKHHREGDVIRWLERVDDSEDGPEPAHPQDQSSTSGSILPEAG